MCHMCPSSDSDVFTTSSSVFQPSKLYQRMNASLHPLFAPSPVLVLIHLVLLIFKLLLLTPANIMFQNLRRFCTPRNQSPDDPNYRMRFMWNQYEHNPCSYQCSCSQLCSTCAPINNSSTAVSQYVRRMLLLLYKYIDHPIPNFRHRS